MTENYFQKILSQTETRFWINNPTQSELESAVASGAFAGTTNPAYGARLLKKEPEYIEGIIDQTIRQAEDDNEAADLVYQAISARFMAHFLPRFNSSDGREGFVTMQDDPRRDHEASFIIEAARRHRRVGRNYMAKIPVIETGMQAMSELVGEGIPICATECFGVAQAVHMCEVFEAACSKYRQRPPFYLTHITGIYDEEIQDYVRREGVKVNPVALRFAGTFVARRQYRVLKSLGFNVIMLGGGVRDPIHFTEWVGGNAHVTMNWSTFEELNEADPPVVGRIEAEDDPALVAELREKIPDFRRAYDDDGMAPSEFDSFAPLLRFRRNFIDGCDDVLRAIAARRNLVSTR